MLVHLCLTYLSKESQFRIGREREKKAQKREKRRQKNQHQKREKMRETYPYFSTIRLSKSEIPDSLTIKHLIELILEDMFATYVSTF